MTPSDPAAQLSGEQKLARRRRSFGRYLALMFAASLVIGLFSGIAVALVDDGSLPPVAIYAALVMLFLVGAWFTRDYFRRVDELDVMDNLWASTIGLYFYFYITASWTMLSDAGLTPEPDTLIIAGTVFGVAFIAYLLRKAGLR